MLTKDVKNKVLSKIKPTYKERENLNKKVKQLLEELRVSTTNLGINADFFVGGSFGKDTFLKNDFDVDIFCRFELTYKNYDLSELLKKILDYCKFKYTRLKGSRDYFSMKYSFLNIELIPVLKIKDLKDAVNTTDVSPLHVKYVLDNTNEEMRDDIRLAKIFFKNKLLYGAESYINGFSGHVIDLLIIYYKSFENLILNVKNWKEQTILDIEKHYKNREEILKVLDKNKIKNLIVIDPILKNRNAASALSSNNYYKFIFIVKKINVLSLEDFVIPEIKIQKYLKERIKWGKENKLDVYGFDFEIINNTSTRDIIGSKLLKLSKRLKKFYQNLGFRIFKLDYYFSPKENRAFILFYFESFKIPKIKLVKGPNIFLKEALRDFFKKRGVENVFQIENYAYCYEKQKYTNLKEIYLGKEDLESLLGKKIDFVKKIKIID